MRVRVIDKNGREYLIDCRKFRINGDGSRLYISENMITDINQSRWVFVINNIIGFEVIQNADHKREN